PPPPPPARPAAPVDRFEQPATRFNALSGLPPPPAAAASPEQAQQDAGKVANAYRDDGAAKATKTLTELVKKHPNDPAYVDALIRSSDETLKKVTAELTDRALHGTPFKSFGADLKAVDMLTRLTTVAEAATPAGREQLGARLAQAVPDTKDAGKVAELFEFLAKSGHGALIDPTMKVLDTTRPKAAAEMTEVRLQQVDRSKDKLEDAQKKAAEMDTRLQTDLAQFGQALTDEQVTSYTQAFREKHADVYAAVRTASDDLAGVLDRNHGALEAAGAGGNKKAATRLYDGYKALTLTPGHAGEAVQWLGRVAHEPAERNPFFKTLEEGKGKGFQEKVRDEFLAPAMPRMQAELIARNAQTPDGAEAQALLSEQTSALLTPLQGAAALTLLGTGIQDLYDVVDMRSTGAPDLQDFHRYKLLTGWSDKNPFMKSLAVMGVVQSGFGAGDSFAHGKIADGIRNSAAFAEGGLELTSGVLATITHAGWTPAAGGGITHNVTGWAQKLTPTLGLVADGLQMSLDYKAAMADKSNPGRWLEMGGTGLAVAGDFCMYAPGVGTGAGLLLKSLGLAVNGIGGVVSKVIDGGKDKKKLSEEQRDLLIKATGLGKKDAMELVKTGPDDLVRLRELGLDAKQLQELVSDPRIKMDSFEPAVLAKAAIAYGLKGQDVIDLFKSAKNEDAALKLSQALRILIHAEGDIGDPRSLDTFRATVRGALGRDSAGKAILAVLERGTHNRNIDFDAFNRIDVAINGEGGKLGL
ncbi:hypothetical protein, partial [Corallococcus exiguus]